MSVYLLPMSAASWARTTERAKSTSTTTDGTSWRDGRSKINQRDRSLLLRRFPAPPPHPPDPLYPCTHVIALHFNFIACVYSIEENCFYLVIPVYWEHGKWIGKECGGGGARMANKKLRQLKLNLYSPGSGLTQLKVRESNSRSWYVVSRQSPLGSWGAWLICRLPGLIACFQVIIIHHIA